MSLCLNSKEKEQLVLQNQKLVYHLVKKLSIPPNDYEDIISIGTIGLIKAAATFDISKDIKFSTYAARCINNEIFMHFRKSESHTNDISLDAPIIGHEEGKEITLKDTIPNSDEDFTEKIVEMEVFIKFISIVLNLLSSKERLVMLHEIAGTKQKVIGKKFNLSQSSISRLQKSLNSKVKSYLTNNKQFNEIFSMAIVGDMYQISFSPKDVMEFNKILPKLLSKITPVDALRNFNVYCDKQRILIRIPADPKSFSFIAQFFQEIEDFNLTFVSDKSHTDSPKIKTDTSDEKNNEVSETETDTTFSETVDSEIKQVRDYMLSKSSFTIKELKQKFPNIPVRTIHQCIVSCKK